MADRVLVATRKGLFFIDRDRTGRWAIGQTAFLGDSVPMILPDPRDGLIYAALGHGHFGSKLHRSTDGGKSWQEIAAPLFPPKPDDVPDTFCPHRKIVIPWRVEQIWALETGGPSQTGTLWCGTIPGGLFRSDDHGATWRLIESLWNNPARADWSGGGYEYPGIHSICVDPRNHDRVVVGVSCGGAWRTRDGGTAWECCATGMRAEYMPPGREFEPNIQDPHLVVRSAGSPDAFWTQHHNGVFRSTDGCDSWQEIHNVPPSVFGFAVAVHPRNGNTAWTVPAIKDEKRIPVDGKLCVSRTRDGGKTFEVLRDGLPQEHAYDLVYRHCLAVDESGERLLFGSTTGGLWVSENGGDRWEAISANLPPVYAVRFA